MSRRDDVAQRKSALTAAQRDLLEQRLRGKSSNSLARDVILPRSGSEPMPLSFAQERLWFLDQLVPGDTTYNCMDTLRLDFAVNAAVLERTLNEIVRRHEILRTTFRLVNGEPVQVVAARADVPLPLVDLRHLEAEEQEQEAKRLATEEMRQPFDL